MSVLNSLHKLLGEAGLQVKAAANQALPFDNKNYKSTIINDGQNKMNAGLYKGWTIGGKPEYVGPNIKGSQPIQSHGLSVGPAYGQQPFGQHDNQYDIDALQPTDYGNGGQITQHGNLLQLGQRDRQVQPQSRFDQQQPQVGVQYWNLNSLVHPHMPPNMNLPQMPQITAQPQQYLRRR